MEENFCSVCNNLLLVEVNETEVGEEGEKVKKLYNVCNICDIKKVKDETKGALYHLNYDMEVIKRNHIVNPYTSYDPTLPKANGINCPNTNCPSGAKKSDIRYIKYDDKNMKYIYICLDCKKGNIEPNLWYL